MEGGGFGKGLEARELDGLEAHRSLVVLASGLVCKAFVYAISATKAESSLPEPPGVSQINCYQLLPIQ
jgi:hypothetical protein